MLEPCWRYFSLLGAFFAIRTALKNNSEKTSKKMQKSRILAIQNRRKTVPKSFQNRNFKKHAKFHRLLCNFSLFWDVRFLENHGFPFGKSLFFKVFTKSVLCQIWCSFGFKNLPKTLPKRGPNPCKIDDKNVLIFNIDFLRFRPRFWKVLGFHFRATLATLAIKTLSRTPPWAILG